MLYTVFTLRQLFLTMNFNLKVFLSYWNCSSSYRVTDLSTLNESLVTGNSSSAVLLRDTFTTAVAKNVIVVALCISINYINGTLVHTFFKHEVPCRPYPWRVKTEIGHWGVCMVKTSWGRLKTPWIKTRNFFLETNTLVASSHNMIAFGLYLYYLNCYVQITALAKEWYNLGRNYCCFKMCYINKLDLTWLVCLNFDMSLFLVQPYFCIVFELWNFIWEGEE